jgi:hypothetical protein
VAAHTSLQRHRRGRADTARDVRAFSSTCASEPMKNAAFLPNDRMSACAASRRER